MTSKLKSFIKRQASSMKHSNLVGLRENLRNRIPITTNDDTYGSNQYIHVSFFDDKNYLSIIECLDGGLQILEAIAKYMREYNNVNKKTINELDALTTRWRSKLKQQSSLSSYHTTKRAQIKMINTPSFEAEILQARYDSIEKLIDEFQNEINKLYPSERSGSNRKHKRTESMVESFEAARSHLLKVLNELVTLKEQQTKAKEDMHKIDVEIERLSFSYPVNEAKLEREKTKKANQERKLRDFEQDIAQKEEEIEIEKKTYRTEATRIYEKCRDLEEERLDLIGDYLTKFVEIAYASEHFDKQADICDELKTYFENKRNTQKDLEFWAKTYGVYDLTTSLESQQSHNNEPTTPTTNTSANPTIADVQRQQSVTEAGGQEQSASNTSTTTKHSSQRRKKE